MVAYLAVRPGRRVSRSQLAAILWPDSVPETARANLRQMLSDVRREAPSLSSCVVAIDRESLVFDSARCIVDVNEFEEMAAKKPEHAVHRYSGPFLDGFESEWIGAKRAELRETYLNAVEAHDDLKLLRAAFNEEPYRESLVQCLLRRLTQSGDRAGAQAIYNQFAETLRLELRCSPSPETSRLLEETKAPRRIDLTVPSNLPAELTSFIGRAKEIAEVRERLGSSRLITLVGTGGCGKTRLSIQVATEVKDGFPDGVWLIELAPVVDPELVPQTMAAVFGVREVGGRFYTEMLASFLGAKQVLIVLDNCEHVLDACVQITANLLRACPYLKVLASSREPLGVAGESTYRIPSLSPPPARGTVSVVDVARSEAVQLFLERARLHRPDFAITPENADAVASVCRRLDGIPLAIELAAARSRSLSVEELDARLDQRFRLLVGGNRAALPRHQTLRGLIDWSFVLLDEKEKRLLCRSSVFANGWTLATAERVLTGEAEASEQIVELLSSLTDKSLVMAETVNGRTRYRLLETVRQYARERLAEFEDVSRVRERHRDFFIDLAEALVAKTRARKEEEQVWPVMEEEQDDLRQAIAFCLEDPQSGNTALRLATCLFGFWCVRGGWWTEMHRWLTAALAHPGGATAWTLRGWAQRELFTILNSRGDSVAARACGTQSLDAYRKAGDDRGCISALYDLAILDSNAGEFDSAGARLEEGIELAKRLGDRELLSTLILGSGFLAFAMGDDTLARSHYSEAREMARQIGHTRNLHSWSSNLALVAFRQGDFESARALWVESLRFHRDIRDLPHIFITMSGLAMLARVEGMVDRSARIYGAAAALNDSMGLVFWSAEDSVRKPELEATRTALGETAFEAAFAQGRSMTLDEAIEATLDGNEG